MYIYIYISYRSYSRRMFNIPAVDTVRNLLYIFTKIGKI